MATVPRTAGTPVPNGQVDRLNARLGNLLPGGKPVTYSSKHYTNDLAGALAMVEAEYYDKVAPPKAVLEKAVARVFTRRTVTQSDSVMYVLSKRTIFGFEVCTGWLVTLHPLGGGPPEGRYSWGLCKSSDFEPSYANALPTLPPKPSPVPASR